MLLSALMISPSSAVEIERMGNCSSGSIWHADLELEFRVFDLGFEVDTKKANENWRFTMKHNGKSVYANTQQSFTDFEDSYAEVEWNLVRPDRKGQDKFRFRAVNQKTGETCAVTIRS